MLRGPVSLTKKERQLVTILALLFLAALLLGLHRGFTTLRCKWTCQDRVGEGYEYKLSYSVITESVCLCVDAEIVRENSYGL